METAKRRQSIARVQAAALADRIVQDIDDRRLKVGDRYLTTAEVAQLFHVRRATANVAMRALAQRGVLVRRLRTGTFVGRQHGASGEAQVKTLYLVESVDRQLTYPPLYEAIGLIRQRLPGVSIHMSTVPARGALDYACDLMRHARSAGEVVGFLLISLPREVYRYFAEIEIPSVVLSDVYTESDSLTTMSGDQQLAGRLLTEHLLKAGHKRIALLTHSHWLAGDNRFLEGIMEALEAAQLPHGALVVRSLPEDLGEFAHGASELLAVDDRPTGVICRSREQAECIARAAHAVIANDKKNGLVNDLPEIVFGVSTGRLPNDCPFAYVVEQDHASQIDRALRMIDEMDRLPNSRGQHVRLPVELIVPRSLRGKPQANQDAL